MDWRHTLSPGIYNYVPHNNVQQTRDHISDTVPLAYNGAENFLLPTDVILW